MLTVFVIITKLFSFSIILDMKIEIAQDLAGLEGKCYMFNAAL